MGKLIQKVLWPGLLFWAGLAQALVPTRSFHDYGVDNWNTSHGLPQTSALSITQDRQGYLWIGTQDGLARFDGLRFNVFDRANADGTDPFNVQASLSDRQGRLWFGTLKGVILREDGHFHEVLTRVPAKDVQGFAQAGDGTIWAATPNGVLRYDGTAFVASSLTAPAYSIAVDGDAIWIGGIGVVTRLDDTGAHPYPVADAQTAPVTRLAVTPQGLWVGTPGGLFELPRDSAALHGQPLDDVVHARVENLLLDHDGNLWIGTPTTLFRRRPDGTFERIRDEDITRNSYVVSAFEDREGNLWFGSRTEGVFRLWNGWASRIGVAEGLSDSLIWSVTRDPQGRIVLGSNSNIMRMDPDGVHEIVSNKQMPNPTAYELNYDVHGRLWIGTRAGLAVFDGDHMVTPPAFSRLGHAQVNAVVPQGEVYWIGAQDGLFRYEGETLRQVPVAAGVAEAPVRGIYIAEDGRLIVSTDTGVRQLDGGVLRIPAWAQPLEGVFVTSVAPIRPGLIGISTRNAGVALESGGHLLLLDERNGLPSNNSWALQALGDYLYVPSINGVWRIPLTALPDPQSAAPTVRIAPERVLGRLTGMQHIHCCNGGGRSRVLTDGDTLWFPAIHGAVRVDTRAIQPSPLTPTVVVEQLKHEQTAYRPGEPIQIDSLRRDIEVDFPALSFREPQGILFRYRLEGYDKQWQDVGTRRVAYYTNLPPGQFRFQVEARMSTSSSVYTAGADPALAELGFTLVPRWYEQRNVQVSAVVALLLLAAAVPLLIRVRYQRRGRLLEALVQERTRSLNDANEQQRHTNLALQHRNDELVTLNDRLEHAQNQLIQSEKLASIGQLAAGMAHEINNPVGYVSSNLYTLEEYSTQLLAALEALSSLDPAHATAQDLADIRRRFDVDVLREDIPQLLVESREGLGRVAKIVRDLKDFSRIDQGENWVRADLHRGLESTLNIVANELKFKAQIVRRYGELPRIECLPAELNQVFMNMLMNAGQAIWERGQITVSTGTSGDHVWVSIQDDGQGIPPEVLPRIFDPFFTTKPVGSGTGLGLSISYGIVLKHHGSIDVESTPGHGTTMRITLPVQQPRPEAPIEPAASVPEPAPVLPFGPRRAEARTPGEGAEAANEQGFANREFRRNDGG